MVYEPAPNPISAYSPAVGPGYVVTVEGVPPGVASIVAFEMYLGTESALGYDTRPVINPPPGVAVGVGVKVGVDVAVIVGVLVAVAVGVFVGVAPTMTVPPMNGFATTFV